MYLCRTYFIYWHQVYTHHKICTWIFFQKSPVGRARRPERWLDSTIEDTYWLLYKFLFSTGLDTAPLELQLYDSFSINKSVMQTCLSKEEKHRQTDCLGKNFYISLAKKVVKWCSWRVASLKPPTIQTHLTCEADKNFRCKWFYVAPG